MDAGRMRAKVSAPLHRPTTGVEALAGRHFASELDKVRAWMAVADRVDNSMPLAPINAIAREDQNWR